MFEQKFCGNFVPNQAYAQSNIILYVALCSLLRHKEVLRERERKRGQTKKRKSPGEKREAQNKSYNETKKKNCNKNRENYTLNFLTGIKCLANVSECRRGYCV